MTTPPASTTGPQSQPEQPLRKVQISTAQSYVFAGITFASKQVLTDFLLFSFLVVVLPFIMVLFSHFYLQARDDLSEWEKTVWTVVPSLVVINLAIGLYVYRVVRDPDNYKKDPPLVIKPKSKPKHD